MLSKILGLIFFLFTLKVPAQIMLDSTQVDTFTIASELNTVWELVYGQDGWIWYTERTGRISRVNPLTKQNKVLKIIPDVHENGAGGQEAGLLGMALHPDFADNPFVFVVYTYPDGSSIKEKLVRFTYSPDTLLNPVIIIDDIPGAGNHNGSRVWITEDSKILMTTGDAGNQNEAQNIHSPSGKILRMNMDGTVPPDNPVPGKLAWAWGLRNSQGLVFTPGGRLYCSEHGDQNDDEINLIEKGKNYGWPEVEGFCDQPAEVSFCSDSNAMEPLTAWTPTIAPAGLDYYGHNEIPEFKSSLLLCTLKEQDLRSIRLNNAGTEVVSEKTYFNHTFGRIRDLCIAPNGDVFIGTSNRDGRGQNPFPLAEDDRIIRLRNADASGYVSPDNANPIRLYPNPNNGKCSLAIRGTNLFSIAIYDLPGRVVFSLQKEITRENIVPIDLPQFASGVYYLVVRDSVRSYHNPIMVSLPE